MRFHPHPFLAGLVVGAILLGLTTGNLQLVRATPLPPFFSTGDPDGAMAMGARPPGFGPIEIEAADDFVLDGTRSVDAVSFTGLITGGVPLANVQEVGVSIYRVFPLDSTVPPDGRVPTRTNSPSDVELMSISATGGTLTFGASVLTPTFTANNSVLNGINPSPNQATGGEGPVTGAEVRFDVTFTPALQLPANHYFLVPQVQVSGGQFYWLSSPRPIVPPGTPFTPDLQAWIRNANLDPDWLRVGTDIVDGATPPTFNGVFSLTGQVLAATGTPTNTSTATATATPTVTPTPTVTQTPTATPCKVSFLQLCTPTPTNGPSSTPTTSPTATTTPPPTSTPTVTATPRATSTFIPNCVPSFVRRC